MVRSSVGSRNENRLYKVESTIFAVAKLFTTDTARRFIKLGYCASSYFRHSNEWLTSFVERFVLQAQAYLNFTPSDRMATANQNLTMMMVKTTSLYAETFSNVFIFLLYFTEDMYFLAFFLHFTSP